MPAERVVRLTPAGVTDTAAVLGCEVDELVAGLIRNTPAVTLPHVQKVRARNRNQQSTIGGRMNIDPGKHEDDRDGSGHADPDRWTDPTEG